MQLRYSDPMVAGRQGLLYSSSGSSDTVTKLNDAPRAAQVQTITVDTAANSTTYTQYLNGVTLTYTTDSSATTTEAATALAAAITAEPLLNGDVTATSATNVVTVTARNAGTAFTITAAAHFTVATTTANAASASVPFGVLVVRDGTSSSNAREVVSGAMTAQVAVLTPTVVNSARYTVTLSVEDTEYTGVYDSDGTATAQEIVEGMTAALNTALPVQSVVVTEDDATLTLTSELAGKFFEVVELTGFALTSDTGPTNFATDVNKVALGLSLESLAYERSSSGTIGYPANSAMSVLRKGSIWVQVQVATVDPNDPVYVGVTSGTTQGLWSNAGGTGYIRLDPAKFSWDGYAASITSNTGTSVNGAVLRVNL